MNVSKLDFFYISLIVMIFVLLTVPKIFVHYTWDEADYIAAAKLGIFSNYLERGSMSIKDFSLFSLSKLNGKNYPDKIFKEYSETNDPFILRHYHPPLPVYFFYIFGYPGGYIESITRLSVVLFGILTLVAVYIFSLSLFDKKTAYLSIFLLAINPTFVNSSTALSFHIFFNFFVIIFLLFFLLAFKNQDNRLLLLSFMVLSLVFLSLEYYLIVFICMIISFILVKNKWLSIKRLRVSKHLAFGVLVFFVSSFILWPGGFFKLSFIKTIAYHIYRIIFYRMEYLHSFVYLHQFVKSQLIFAVLAIFSVAYFFWYCSKKKIKHYSVILIFLVVFTLFISKIFLSAAYMLLPITLLSIIVSYFFVRISLHKKLKIFVLVLLLLTSVHFLLQHRYSINFDEQFYNDISLIGNTIGNKSVLASNLPTFSFYLPDKMLTKLYVSQKGEFYVKSNGAYENLTEGYLRQKIDFVLLYKEENINPVISKVCKEVHKNRLLLLACD